MTMARLPRFVLPGHPQHLIQRGNDKNAIFIADEDYGYFLEILGRGCKKHNCDVHAYVLMTNHVHLLITPYTEDALGKLMQFVGRYYVQYFNSQYARTGTLWEGRYKATLIDSEQYLLTCYRYIELNPVRAAMVLQPQDYQWSSYRANALGHTDTLVVPHEFYQRLGPDGESRQEAYRKLFENEIDGSTLRDIRDATNKAWVLGNDRFRENVARLLNRRTAPKPKGGDRRSEEYKRHQAFNRV